MKPTIDIQSDADNQRQELSLQERRQRLLKPETEEKHFADAWNQLSPWPDGDTEKNFEKTLEEFKEIFG